MWCNIIPWWHANGNSVQMLTLPVSQYLRPCLLAGYINLEGLMRNGSGEDCRGAEGAPPNPLSLPVDEGAKHVKALQATLDLGTGRLYSVVMLPADPR